MTPANIDNSVPKEEEVDWAVQKLQGHRSGGPSQMCAGHLQEWLMEHQTGEGVKESEMKTADSALEGREIRANDRDRDRKEE